MNPGWAAAQMPQGPAGGGCHGSQIAQGGVLISTISKTVLSSCRGMGNFYNDPRSRAAQGPISQKRVRELKRQLEEAGSEKKTSSKAMVSNALLESMKADSASVRSQRTQTKDAALQKKKVNYRHKNISSKIIRSKTSVAAKQVVSQAHREVQRLKKEKAKGEYDNEEMDLAIEHAKAMERVARKKVRHLEQEEMAKVSSGNAVIFGSKDEEESGSKTETESAEEIEKELEEEAMDEQLRAEEMAEARDFETEVLQDDLTEELLEEMSENMEDFLSEMGFEELEDAFLAPDGDMDPQEIKELEIKHRNKEMKDIVKADSEYLKALFDHFQKTQGEGGVSGGISGGVSGGIPGGIIDAAPMVGTDVPQMGSAAIDVSV